MPDSRAAATKQSDAPTNNPKLLAWVEEMAKLTAPDQIVWCDGSEEEKQRLTKYAVDKGILIPLNQEKRPGCYLHRSNPNDVARTEHLTFVCTRTKEAAGPNNNWMAPKEGYAKLGKLFDGSMKGRTMYVVPYLMGPAGSPFSKVGIEITDSVYVVLNMRIMTRMGRVALDTLGELEQRVQSRPALHAWTSIPRGVSSVTSPRTTRSGRSAAATAGTPSSARNAWPSASPPFSDARKAGSPSTC